MVLDVVRPPPRNAREERRTVQRGVSSVHNEHIRRLQKVAQLLKLDERRGAPLLRCARTRGVDRAAFAAASLLVRGQAEELDRSEERCRLNERFPERFDV